MFKKQIIKIILPVIIVCTISCVGGVSKNDAVKFMDEYFETVKKNDFSLIEPYYSDKFYEKTNKETWKETYNNIHLSLGTLLSAELESWSVRSVFGTSDSGKYFIFVYSNKYVNGSSEETIDLFVPSGTKEIKIIRHNIDPKAGSDIFMDLKII